MISKKKVIGSIVISLLLFANVWAESTNLTSSNNEYKEVVYDNNFNFKAYREAGIIEIKWTKYEGDYFKYYKLMRSETLSNPVYPDQSAFKVLDDNSITELKISNYNTKDAVYRVCVITDERGRSCSNIIKLEWFIKEEKNYKAINSSKANNNHTNLQDKSYTTTAAKAKKKASYINGRTAQKAKELVKRFVEKIERKFENNSDRVRGIESTIGKLESLANTNEKYKPLISYITNLLKIQIEKYDNSFDEIEKIFNDL